MVVASGTVSLLPDCDVGVVVRDEDPVGGVTEVPVLPGLMERVAAWAGGLEDGGCLVAHRRGETHSLELWGGSVLAAVVLTVVLGE